MNASRTSVARDLVGFKADSSSPHASKYTILTYRVSIVYQKCE